MAAGAHMGSATQSATPQPELADFANRPIMWAAGRFQAPDAARGIIKRDCARRMLRLSESNRLLLVKAPIGYGKTSAMAECHAMLQRRPRSTSWLNLGAIDRKDELPFYLLEAVRRLLPLRSRQTIAIDANANKRSLLGMLCNELWTTGEPHALFLDDFDAAIGGETEELFALMLRDGPATVHFIVSSQHALTLPTGRLRTTGQMIELGSEDLQFSRDEAAQVFLTSGSGKETAAWVATAISRTEGWPSAIKLLAHKIDRYGQSDKAVKDVTGDQGDIAALLNDEVWLRLTAPMRRFLTVSALFERFNAALCDYACERTDSADMIAAAVDQSLFLSEEENEAGWYRYNRLFTEFLRHQATMLPAEERVRIHRRASEWFANEQQIDESFHHALDGNDPLTAAKLLNENWPILFREGRIFCLNRWYGELPDAILEALPRLQLHYVLGLAAERHFPEARAMLERIQGILDRNQMELDAAELDELRATLLHRRLMLAKFQDQVPELERLCEQWRNEALPSHAFLDATVRLSMIYVLREQYRFAEIEKLDAIVETSFQRSGELSAMVYRYCINGGALAKQGKVELAMDGYRQAMTLALRVDGDPGIVVATPALLLAEAHLERGEFEAARALFASYLPLANKSGLVDQLIAGYVGAARLAAHEGDRAAAEQSLAEGFKYAVVLGLRRLFWHVVAERVRQCLHRNDLIGATRIATDADLPKDMAALLPAAGMTSEREAMAIAWARLAIATGKHADALQLLRAWINFARHRGCVATQVRMELLATHAHVVSGETRTAQRQLRDTLPAAVKAGLALCVVEAGEPVRMLLPDVYPDGNAAGLADLTGQLRTLLASVKPNVPDKPATMTPPSETLANQDSQAEPLTQREIEILRAAEHGLLDKEIAHQLNLTAGTVRWYMQRIYDKLGVRRRQLASQRARALGYL